MALIAMVDLRIETELAQGTDTADSEKELLFQTVLPVTSVEMMGH